MSTSSFFTDDIDLDLDTGEIGEIEDEMDNKMDLSEALSMVQFTKLSRSNKDEEFSVNAKRADPMGGMLLCAPPASVDKQQNVVAVVPGIAFRAVSGNDIEAVRVEPPVMMSSRKGTDGIDIDDEEEGDNQCVEGGGIQIIGRFSLSPNTKIVRIACSNDARLLIAACSDGTLICLSVTYFGDGGSEEISVQFQLRWELNVTDKSIQQKSNTPSRRFHHIHYDVQYNPDGSVLRERRWSEDDVIPGDEGIVTGGEPMGNDDNENDAKGTKEQIHFPTLDFFINTEKKYDFIAVAEDSGHELSYIIWMDAASSSSVPPSSTASSFGPPPLNLWPLKNTDLVNVSNEDATDSSPLRITCAAVFPGSSCNVTAQEPNTILAFGTNKGSLGIASVSTLGAAKVIFLDHPQSFQEDDDEDLPCWKITHLNWLENCSLAVGLSRVIVDAEAEDDEEDEDDPNEHQASFLMGTMITEGDGDLDPMNSSLWSWCEMGDVVPFFSIPKGGHHAFHTTLLPGNRSSTTSPTLLLVGCNVASEVAVLSRQHGDDEWAMLDLMEGNQMACPTDEEDEFLFLMGLTVVLLPLRLAGVNDNDNSFCYPFSMLTSTDGSLLGFAPYHRTLGERFLARPWNASEMAAVQNRFNLLAERNNQVEVSKVDFELRSPPKTPAAVTSQPGQTQEESADIQNRDGCFLAGLDLGLQSVIEKSPVIEPQEEADSDPDACSYDDDEADSSRQSLNNEDEDASQEAKKEGNNAPSSQQPAFGSGLSSPSFNFEAPTFSFQGSSTSNLFQTNKTAVSGFKTTTGGFSFGSTGGATFGSPSALGGGMTKSSTKPSSPVQQQRAASAASSLPVFGSGTVKGLVGFHSLKPSLESSQSGFGSASESKFSVFGSNTDSSTGFGTLSKKASSNAEVWKVEKHAEEEGKKVSSATAQINQKSSIQPFGSGTSAPNFGFKSKEGGFISFVHPSNPKNDQSPQSFAFNAFGNKHDTGNPVLTSGTLKPQSDVKSNENSPAESLKNHIDVEGTRDKEIDTSTHVVDNSDSIFDLIKTPSGSRALKAFNTVLSDIGETDSFLPSTKFEAVVDEVGEGFHGEELERQLTLLDPKKTGRIERNAFVKWYCKLVDREDSDESSQDSEVAEEKTKAEEAFDNICNDSSDTIDASDFAKLLESMGTTYCEEEHRRTVKKISEVDSSSGKKVIKKSVFVQWYVDWLFGDGDSDEESEAESRGSDAASPKNESKETSEGWGSLFKTLEKGSWKCEVCMVTNGPSAVKCSACETEKPGAAAGTSSDSGSASTTLPKPLASSGSIGTGGFSFGGSSNSSSIGPGGFTFGGFNPSLSNSIPETRKTSSTSESTVPAPSSGGFNFASATDNKVESGFQSMFASKTDDTKTTEKSSSTSSPSSGYPPMSSAAPKPFGSSTSKKNETKSKLASGAYPPMSATAPKPFGGFGSTQSSKSTLSFMPSSSTATVPASSTGGFNFASATDNKVESGFQNVFGSKKDDTNTAEKSPATSSSSLSGCPPKSSAAPKPFGSSATKKDEAMSKSTSGGYPPISSAAPKPFGGFGSTQPSPSTLSFIPSSSTAAVPVQSSGGFKFVSATENKVESGFQNVFRSKKDDNKTTEKSSSTLPSSLSGYPPLSSAAPKPFGSSSTKKDESTSTSASAGYPPMSTTAPKPFGRSGSTQPSPFTFSSTPASSSISSSPAPITGGFNFASATDNKVESGFQNVFGSKRDDTKTAEKSPATSSSSSGYPPMSSAAPKPFGSSATKTDEATSKPASGGYPPMSSAAPQPFGGFRSTQPSPSTFFSTPALSNAAVPAQSSDGFNVVSAMDNMVQSGFQNLFGSKKDDNKTTEKSSSTSSSSSGYPPLSSVAPKPFGSSATKTDEEKSKSASVGYPPISTTAPKPFGRSGSIQPSPFTFSSTPASSSISTSPAPITGGVNFASATDNKVESGFQNVFGSKRDDTKTAEKSPATSSSSSLSSGYPPMSSAAPKPFGSSVTKNDETKSKPASGGYPPMSSAAPKPFGSSATKKDEAKSKPASGGYPPMSSAAPQPFGGFGNTQVSKTTTELKAASVPAPSRGGLATDSKVQSGFQNLFGSKKDDTKTAEKSPVASSSSLSGYPPMSSAAPKPFGSSIPKNDETKSKPASGGYPPMSSAAPKPFGSSTIKKDETKSKLASGGYPPMSSAAPTPFSGFGNTQASKTTLSFIPSSSTAAVPAQSSGGFNVASATENKVESGFQNVFGSKKVDTSTSEISPSASLSLSSGYPPLSSAAPKPFGSSATKKDETKSNPESSGYPPMSTTAPKPFGRSGSTQPSKSTLEMKAAALPASSTSGFKFVSATENKVESGFQNIFGSKKDDTKTAEKSPATSSSSSGYPPMSSAAPRPFGSSATTNDETKSKPASGGYPPMSTKASAEPSGVALIRQSFMGPGSVRGDVSKSSLGYSQLESNERSFIAHTKLESEFWKRVNDFHQKSSLVKGFLSDFSARVTPDLQESIQHVVDKYDEQKSICGVFNDNISSIQSRLVILFSVHDDLSRQKNESEILVKDQLSGNRLSSILIDEPLDAESELMRREIMSKCREVQSLLLLVENRLNLNNEIFLYSTGPKSDCLRPSDYIARRSRTKFKSPAQMSRSATDELFKSLLKGYDRTRDLVSFVAFLSDKGASLMNSVEDNNDVSNSISSSTSAKKSKSRDSFKATLSPLPMKHLSSPLPRNYGKGSTSDLVRRLSTLRRMSRATLPQREIDTGDAEKIFFLRGTRRYYKNFPKSLNSREWKSSGQNELFKYPSNQPTNVSNAQTLMASPVAKTLFASPIIQERARPEWNTYPDSPIQMLQINIPKNLSQIKSSDLAKSTLAKFGTSPDKLAKGRDIISRDAAESLMPKNSAVEAGSSKPPRISTDSSSSYNNAVSSNFSSKSLDPTTSSNSTTAFPPMPTRSPKPLSRVLNQQEETSRSTTTSSSNLTAGSASSKPFLGSNNIDYKLALTSFYKKHNSLKLAEVDASLQKYKGKEAEMFVALAKKYNTSNALNDVFISRVQDVNLTDYKALLTLYLSIFNPSKTGDVPNLLAKYKGREDDFFAAISKKYYSCNPLKLDAPPAPPASPFSQDEATREVSRSVPETSFEKAGKSTQAPQTSDSPADKPTFARKPEQPTMPTDAASPFTFEKDTSSNIFGTTCSTDKDYHKILSDFYREHNPQKLSEVGQTLDKYKGREPAMFAKLAQKYKTNNPLHQFSTSTPHSPTKPPTQAAPPASCFDSNSVSSSFAGLGGLSGSLSSQSKVPGEPKTAPGPNPVAMTTAAFGPTMTASPSPFAKSSVPSSSPFTSNNTAASFPSAFNTTPASASPSPFGAFSPTATPGGLGAFSSQSVPGESKPPFSSAPIAPFSSSKQGPSSFGNSASGSSAFGGITPAAPFSSSPFGQSSHPASAPSLGFSNAKFGGRSPRDMLISFYQTHNPSKVGEVDKALAKYAGKEEQMFLNLAKKYNVDPSMFGINMSAQAPAPAPNAFGVPSSLGGTGGFGSSSTGLSGFGAASVPNNTFGSLASGSSGGFGGFTSSASSFGGTANTFGSSGNNPFGAPRR